MPSNDAGTAGGPTVLRIMLGANLRRLREGQGISREDAGYHIRSSESKISRIELGRVSFKERDVADLLTFYGLPEGVERERLLSLAREANTPGWWHRYSDVLPSWFQPYIGLESAASLIRNYEVQFVPGLLQTADYSRVIFKIAFPQASQSEIERRVELRATRQQLLTRENPPQFWGIVDEAALRRPVGGKEVMRQQIRSLIDATALPNIQVQVVPFRIGIHSAHSGSFSILRFAEPDLPDIVCAEQITSALYFEKRDDVDQYLYVMETLCIEAATPEASVDILHRILHDIEATE